MKIVWFTWKDRSHPAAGGAEVLNEELAKRLVQHGHELVMIVGGFKHGKDEEKRDGYRIIRVGNRYSVYAKARTYYRKHLCNWPDIVIEEINTVPFFAHQFVDKNTPIVYLFYQLCREIWFYQMPLPFSLIGYLVEPFYLRRLAKNKNLVLTESMSARDDLARYGFDKKNTTVFSVGIEIDPVPSLTIAKFNQPTMLSLGSIRKMKRTDQQIKAFEYAKHYIPDLQLHVAGTGDDKYFHYVQDLMNNSPFRKDIHYHGRVTASQKKELMQKSHVITVTSLKEGWGLIVTEANSQGTPAVVYNTDGLRDSVKNNVTGIVVAKNTPQALGKAVVDLLKSDSKYATLQKNAWGWSKELTFDREYLDAIKVLEQARQI